MEELNMSLLSLFLSVGRTGSFSRDACDLVQDSGECQNYTLKWYYDKEQKMCGQFWYGGCGGNKNRFETQEECGFLCIESS